MPHYEILPTSEENPWPQPRPMSKFRSRSRVLWVLIVITALAVLGLPWLLLRSSRPASTASQNSSPWPPLNGASQTLNKRVYLQVGHLGPEGFGSILQHLKQSIVLSRALDSSLVLASTESEHGYRTSDIFNGDGLLLETRRSCRLRDTLPFDRRDHLVRGLCAGDSYALKEMAEIKRQLSVCTSILDTAEGELTEDLNGCVVDWIREKLGPSPGSLYARPNPLPLPLPIPPLRPITIGVHVRWGDTVGSSSSQPPTTFRGSMSIRSITSVLSDIRAAVGGHANATQLTIAMENADHRVLAQLGETGPYSILDSGDGLADLRALSQNDVLLLGESSYGVLVHLIAPPGLSIVELDGDRGKYSNASDIGRDLVFLGRDYSVERLRASLFGERS